MDMRDRFPLGNENPCDSLTGAERRISKYWCWTHVGPASSSLNLTTEENTMKKVRHIIGVATGYLIVGSILQSVVKLCLQSFRD